MKEFNLTEVEEKLIASMTPEKLKETVDSIPPEKLDGMSPEKLKEFIDSLSPEKMRETIEQVRECFNKVFELRDHISSLAQSMKNLVEDYGQKVTLPAEFGLVVGLSMFGEDSIDFCIGHKEGVNRAIQNLIRTINGENQG